MKFYLAILVTVGFLAVTISLGLNVMSADDNPSTLLLFGALSSNFGAVVGYYFGSSEGSAIKTQLLKGKADEEGK